VKVRVPASTANLGPGFDHLAAALSLELELSSGGEGWRYIHEGPGEPDEPPDGQLVASAIESVLGHTPDVGLEMRSSIPVGRGLGSSGAAIVAGLLMGSALAGHEPDAIELLRLAGGLEGHADNVAASLYGGVINVVPTSSGDEVQQLLPGKSVRPLILLARERLSTQEARDALPATVPMADVVASSSRAAGLLAMLTGTSDATAARLWEFTNDVLHQPYRAPLMPRTAEAISTLRNAGIAAAVSGAGPSIVCLVVRGDEAGTRQVAGELEGWELLELDWSSDGARITER
jgi:homoserine kinase